MWNPLLSTTNSCISTHFALKDFKKEKHLTVYSSDFCPRRSFPLISPPCRLFEILQHFTTCTHMQSDHALLPDLSAAPSPPPLATCFSYPCIFSENQLGLFSRIFFFFTIRSFFPFTSPPPSSITILFLLSLLSDLLHAITRLLLCPRLPFMSVSTLLSCGHATNKQHCKCKHFLSWLPIAYHLSGFPTCHWSFPKAHVTPGGASFFFQ